MTASKTNGDLKGWFIAGTDTEVGKTYCSQLLIRNLVELGKQVVAFKPVASGASLVDGELRNDDAVQLMRAANSRLNYSDINPYCFPEPISPHWAAARAGVDINIPTLARHIRNKSREADHCIVEGVGGWYAPLSERTTAADLAVALELPVVLVVGLRLGCLSHAALTGDAIHQSGLRLAAWVANRIDVTYQNVEQTQAHLTSRLGVPCLGVVPNAPSPTSKNIALNLEPLLLETTD